MPRLPDHRVGTRLHVKGRPLPFSLWPVGRGIRRYGLSDFLFAKSPWAVMEAAVAARTVASRKNEALAFLDQAKGFFDAAAERTVAATPLLLYYAFMNLAKAVILASGRADTLDRAMHGLKDDPGAGTGEIGTATVVVKSSGADPSIFPLYAAALGFAAPPNNATYSVAELMAQVVVGHRLWREAGKKERFVALEDLRFYEGPGEAWLRLFVVKGDLTRFGISQKRLRAEGRLDGLMERVALDSADGYGTDDEMLCYEQLGPVAFGHRAADILKPLVETVRPILWRSATSTPPYRKYYVHLTPPDKDAERLPQLLSLYLLFFYFGSVTRYRPHVFEAILKSDYGPFIREFIASQPDQLLYLLATELCEREVVKPALI